MPEPRVLLVAPALNDAESTARLEQLGRVSLTDATKYLVTHGKFDARHIARTFNVESGYPAEPVRLQTLATWAEAGETDPRFRDGYDLFCLKSILERTEACDCAILLRDPAALDQGLPTGFDELRDRLFLRVGANLLFNVAHSAARDFLDHAWDLFATGAVYAMAPYSFDDALLAAAEAQQLGKQTVPGR